MDVKVLKTFMFKTKSKVEYKAFEQFLRSSVIQDKTFCQIIDECETKACLLMLNRTETEKQIISNNQPYSVFRIIPSQE